MIEYRFVLLFSQKDHIHITLFLSWKRERWNVYTFLKGSSCTFPYRLYGEQPLSGKQIPSRVSEAPPGNKNALHWEPNDTYGNGPYRPICLNIWSPFGGSWGRIRSCGFAWGNMLLGMGFGVSKDSQHFEFTFCLLLAKEDVSSWHLPLCPLSTIINSNPLEPESLA